MISLSKLDPMLPATRQLLVLCEQNYLYRVDSYLSKLKILHFGPLGPEPSLTQDWMVGGAQGSGAQGRLRLKSCIGTRYDGGSRLPPSDQIEGTAACRLQPPAGYVRREAELKPCICPFRPSRG